MAFKTGISAAVVQYIKTAREDDNSIKVNEGNLERFRDELLKYFTVGKRVEKTIQNTPLFNLHLKDCLLDYSTCTVCKLRAHGNVHCDCAEFYPEECLANKHKFFRRVDETETIDDREPVFSGHARPEDIAACIKQYGHALISEELEGLLQHFAHTDKFKIVAKKESDTMGAIYKIKTNPDYKEPAEEKSVFPPELKDGFIIDEHGKIAMLHDDKVGAIIKFILNRLDNGALVNVVYHTDRREVCVKFNAPEQCFVSGQPLHLENQLYIAEISASISRVETLEDFCKMVERLIEGSFAVALFERKEKD